MAGGATSASIAARRQRAPAATRAQCVPKIRFCNIGGEGHRELGVI
jgi:hypothetical protein